MRSFHTNVLSRPVAQLAEWRSPKPQVGGSIPSWPANYQKIMKNSNISVKEIILWLGIVLLTCLAFFVTYYFSFTGPIKAIVWIGWLVFAGLCGILTQQGKQVYGFAKEAKIELQKVVWPTRQETIQTTSIVMGMVALAGFILWGVDSGMMWIIGKITHLG